MRRSLLALSLTLGLSLVAAEAAAQRQPVRYQARPLTLPEKTVRIDGHFPAVGFYGSDAVFGFFAGGGYGIMDDLEVFGTIIPVSFSPSPVRFQDPVVGATYRFLEKDSVEIGAGVRLQIPVDDGRFFLFNPRLPILFRAGDVLRIDTGVNLAVAAPTGGGGDAVFGLFGPGQFAPLPFAVDAGIPARFNFQVIDQFWIGANTGLGFVSGPPGARGDGAAFLPLGWSVGGTIPGDDGPLVDIRGGFEFPFFILTSEGPVNRSVVVTELWIFHIGGSFYLPL